MKSSIYPCLWFDGDAKAAADLYCSVFPDSRITSHTPVVVTFEIGDQQFMGLNGGPAHSINPSISFYVVYETEAEVALAWEKLLVGGSMLMPLDQYEWSKKYGWLQDRFGVNWQLSVGKFEEVGQKVTPSLMFVGEQQGKAEEAINCYTSLFAPASIKGIARYSETEPDQTGTIKHAQFTLGNTGFMAMDSSGPHDFQFSEGISLVVECETQAEIDHYWKKLTEGGSEGQCGWLKDQFGVSWQIVPTILSKLMSDSERAPRVMQAFLSMKKFDIATLVNA